MKRFFTTVSMVALFINGAFSQTDITPSRYKFNSLSVGHYSLDKASPGANPPASDVDVKNNWNNGFITALNGQLSSLTSGQGSILNSFFQVLDMGGEVGKVLCMKGGDSTFPYGVAGNAGFGLAWWNLAFYTDPVLTPSITTMLPDGVSVESASPEEMALATKKATVRLRLVFHIHQNTIDNSNKLFDILGYTYTGNHKKDDLGNLSATQIFKSGDFADVVFNEETEEEELTYNPNKWIACEYDFVAPEIAGAPLRFTFRFGGNAAKTTLLIKEMSMIVNPTGDPVENQVLTLVSNPVSTSVNEQPQVETLHYFVSNGILRLKNVNAGEQVVVYSITGQVVHKLEARGQELELPLRKGIYVVQAGSKKAKIAIH